jgi:hypothetical protein
MPILKQKGGNDYLQRNASVLKIFNKFEALNSLKRVRFIP